MFTLEFETENAAFADGNGPEACAVILHNVAAQIALGFTSGVIHDANGNRVGEWSGVPAESDDGDEHDQFRDDVEADADVLRTAGMGTDEDYGLYDGSPEFDHPADWD